jgi:hypothetical protein
VAEAQARGLDVQQGTLAAPELDGRQFAVITMWDVIEHVADPVAELRQAYQHLQPGGWLALHTMNIDSLPARLMGPRWPWLMDMHLYYFSQATLSAMLRRAGYDVIWSGTQGRYLRLGYLSSRLHGLSARAGKATAALIGGLGLEQVAIPVNSGDLFTVYARRPICP